MLDPAQVASSDLSREPLLERLEARNAVIGIIGACPSGATEVRLHRGARPGKPKDRSPVRPLDHHLGPKLPA